MPSSVTHTVSESGPARVQVNGIELVYESFGDSSAPPLLLIQGLGMQMIAVDDGFWRDLAARGFRVIRFDNRDAGLSTRFGLTPLPGMLKVMLPVRLPRTAVSRRTVKVSDPPGAIDDDRPSTRTNPDGSASADVVRVSSPELPTVKTRSTGSATSAAYESQTRPTPCFDANASARLRSRAATATISASPTLRAGLIAAAGAMRAAPRMPMRTVATPPHCTTVHPRRVWEPPRLRHKRPSELVEKRP